MTKKKVMSNEKLEISEEMVVNDYELEELELKIEGVDTPEEQKDEFLELSLEDIEQELDIVQEANIQNEITEAKGKEKMGGNKMNILKAKVWCQGSGMESQMISQERIDTIDFRNHKISVDDGKFVYELEDIVFLPYTTMNDCSGNEIYVGDIIQEFESKDGTAEFKEEDFVMGYHIVRWDSEEGRLEFLQIGTGNEFAKFEICCSDNRIIGNIYENKEMISSDYAIKEGIRIDNKRFKENYTNYSERQVIGSH